MTPGNLKLDAPPLSVNARHFEELQQALADRPVWLAASTHPGEEEQILEAHRMIAETVDSLVTLIVPRHPERGDAIADILRHGHASFAQRSKDETMQADRGGASSFKLPGVTTFSMPNCCSRVALISSCAVSSEN